MLSPQSFFGVVLAVIILGILSTMTGVYTYDAGTTEKLGALLEENGFTTTNISETRLSRNASKALRGNITVTSPHHYDVRAVFTNTANATRLAQKQLPTNTTILKPNTYRSNRTVYSFGETSYVTVTAKDPANPQLQQHGVRIAELTQQVEQEAQNRFTLSTYFSYFVEGWEYTSKGRDVLDASAKDYIPEQP